MEDLERIQDRLDRIGSIQPVLAALRTISLASWRQALRRREQVQLYVNHLVRAASHLPDHVLQRPPGRQPSSEPALDTEPPVHRVMLVLGSERGLCGRFNATAVDRAEELLAQELPANSTVELLALGSRIGRMLSRRGHRLGWTGKLSLTALPPFELARELAERWLARYEDATLDELHIVYNEYAGLGRYQARTTLLLPPTSQIGDDAAREDAEPTAIIETDPQRLFARLLSMLLAAQFHEILIRSAAAEHATRYQLMDGASQNAERIIDELTLAVQSARQRAITRDMQELAAGAGLIGRQAA